jgi:toxin-antitoxin system PIN domain toxin
MKTRMNLFFPDLNVWLALTDNGHEHSDEAWNWLNSLPNDAKLLFSRYTQIGLLRLLVTPAVMGEATLTLGKAWGVYDSWLEDPRVDFYPDPREASAAFRRYTAPFATRKASKAIGDSWLLACASELNARLVTFDRALYEFSRKQGKSAVMPS